MPKAGSGCSWPPAERPPTGRAAGGPWRGPADVIAVGAHLAGVVPLVAMALLDLRWVGARWNHDRRLWWHAACVALFLVVAHVAMIFGMLDPTLMGYLDPAAAHAPAGPAMHGQH